MDVSKQCLKRTRILRFGQGAPTHTQRANRFMSIGRSTASDRWRARLLKPYFGMKVAAHLDILKLVTAGQTEKRIIPRDCSSMSCIAGSGSDAWQCFNIWARSKPKVFVQGAKIPFLLTCSISVFEILELDVLILHVNDY